MRKPLVLVLVGQLVVLAGSLAFLALRRADPPPLRQARSHPLPAGEEVLHAPLVRLEEAPPAPAPAEPVNGDWAQFPAAAPAVAAAARPAPASPQGKLSVKDEPEPQALETLIAQLADGNARFVEGVSRQRDAVAVRQALGEGERATAVVVTCTDSRVVPELLFDQPLGTFAVVRLPGAQVDEVAVRAVEDSVSRLQARAVLVLGHLGCHHVQDAVAQAGTKKSSRLSTLTGALSGLSGSLQGEALDDAATAASVSFSARELRRRSKPLARSAEVTLLRVVYAPRTGAVRWLDAEQEPAPTPAPRNGRR